MTVDLILISALGFFLTFYVAMQAMDAYRKAIREGLLAENKKIMDDLNKKIMDDLNKLIDSMKL